MGRAAVAGPARAGGGAGLAVRESSFRLEWMAEPWDDVTARGRMAARRWPSAQAGPGPPERLCARRAAVAGAGAGGRALVRLSLVARRARRGGAGARVGRAIARRVQAGWPAADLVVAPTRAMLRRMARGLWRASPCAGDVQRQRARPVPPQFRRSRASWRRAASGTRPRTWRRCEAAARRLPWPVRVAGRPRRRPTGGDGRCSRASRSLGVLRPADSCAG